MFMQSCVSSMTHKVGLRNVLIVNSLYKGPNAQFKFVSYCGKTVVKRIVSKTVSMQVSF